MTTNRRLFLTGASAGIIMATMPAFAKKAGAAFFPFPLGVMSGEPATDGFVIWTRICADPFKKRGGMTNADVQVRWEVATDPAFANVVQSGLETARIASVHTVHVGVVGLQPDRPYWYRFSALGESSRVGKCRTLPVIYTRPIRFATCGCQQWENGWFNAYAYIAQQDLDFMIFTGDAIYTDSAKTGSGSPSAVRPFNFPSDAETVDAFRGLYAHYWTDPDLQDALASCAYITSFDDHDGAINNWWSDQDKRGDSRKKVLALRAAAAQAWYEHSPVRRRGYVDGSPNIQMYRSFKVADLMDIAVLDTRQFRTPPACNVTFAPDCSSAELPGRQVLGPVQEAWLNGFIQDSQADFQVLAQQILFTSVDYQGGKRMDAWDGSADARERLLRTSVTSDANLVVLSGDIHMAMANNIIPKGGWPDEVVGAEFNSSSISSGFPDAKDLTPHDAEILAMNPQMIHYADKRGCNIFDVDRERMQVQYMASPTNRVRSSAMFVDRTLVVETANPGIVS